MEMGMGMGSLDPVNDNIERGYTAFIYLDIHVKTAKPM